MSDNIKRVAVDSVVKKFESPIKHTLDNFNIKSEELSNLTGDGVSICMLDTGVVEHKSVKKAYNYVNFTNDPNADFVSHATMMAGIISGNDKKSLIGLAPDANVYYCKIVDDTCKIKFDSIVAGVLWGVIKEVDIIFVPFVTEIEHHSLLTAINKAYNSNIFVIAPVGNEKTVSYPAKYDKVLSVGCYDANGSLAVFSSNGNFNVKGTNIPTAYKDNSYAVVSGTSMASAVATSVCARVIQNYKSQGIKYNNSMIFNEMKKLSPFPN